jgi:predicted helicase
VSKKSRKSPAEKEYEKVLESYINDVKADPRAAAVRLQEQDAKINALQKQLRYQTIVAAAREKELEKEVATLRDI